MKIYDAPHNFARVEEHDICPTLIARAGTGGGNVPLVLGSAQANAAILDDDTCPTLTAQMGTGGNNMPLVLMDQGGGVMSVEYDKVGTLRAQTHGHEPLVLDPYNFKEDDKCFTLRAGTNTPMTLQEAYRISSDASNCMRSGNPYSGVNKVDLAPTVDTTDPSPSKGQGGIAIVTSGGALPHVFKLRSGKDGGGKGYLGQDDKSFTLATNNDQYLFVGDNNGNANEANARTLLRILRKEVGAEAFAEWRSRVLDSLQQAEVLRSKVYGESVRAEAKEKGPELDDGSLSRTEDLQTRTLRDLWERGPNRSTPQGLELAKQLTREFGESLSRMSHEDSPEGSMGTCRVRKLTPIETERLQGFPDNWTRIPYRGKDEENCPDSPRYKAIGNSWCVPCVRWIGERIQAHLDGKI